MKILSYLAFLCLFFSACNSIQSQSNSDSSKRDSALIDTTAKNLPKKTDTVAKLPNWDYDTTVDAMTSRKTITAHTDAINNFELKAPYDGYNNCDILVRRRRGLTEIMLRINKGQFMVGVEGMNIKVRFDDNPYSEYFCTPTTDYNPSIIFINNADTFIEHLKKANKLLIEADIYDNGGQQFEFTVDGFKWGASKKIKLSANYYQRDYGFVSTKYGIIYVGENDLKKTVDDYEKEYEKNESPYLKAQRNKMDSIIAKTRGQK